MRSESIQGFSDPQADRYAIFNELHNTIQTNLPKGFESISSENQIQYVVPIARYPKGYHAKKGEPLPFIVLAIQKHHIALYHMGLYGNEALMRWFEETYAELNISKLDMGKSCIRFKHKDQIPFDLIANLCSKLTVDEYIAQYESILQNARSVRQ